MGQPSAEYVLRLFVTGTTTRSIKAIASIRRICQEHLRGRYQLEVIDLYQHPERAKDEQIIAAPTLIRQLPLPLRRLVGDLSDSEKVLLGLAIEPKPPMPVT
ncbi:MAG: circadian clock KaiB family protein [Alphaproteobacteria bacterium]|nr:circadian clock KaiB family protein [Alphaproteobacteria bacterium]